MFSVEIKCADCGLTGYKNFTKDTKNPIEKTIEYWNTRVPVTVNKDEFDPHNTVVGKRLDAGCTDWTRISFLNSTHIVYSLDKDILQQGIPPHMKVYSPSTCMWVPITVNSIQACVDKLDQSAIPYIGVSLTHGNTYNVRLRDKYTGKKVNAGNFDNPEVAANVYNVYSKIYGVGYQNDVPYIPFNECLQHKCFASKNTKFADMINIIEEKE